MKQIIINGIVVLVVTLLAPQLVQAQGTMTYVSSLDQTSTGGSSIGSDSWLAAPFRTGNNVGGYELNSIQLGMTEASGNPSGFTAMLYSAIGGAGIFPGSSLGTLDGSLNPVASGTYTYTAPSNLTLSPSTDYFIVLTAGTAVANGAYEWSVTDTFSPTLNGGWHGDNFFVHSSDGFNWSFTSGTYARFALNATAVPEPGVLSLFGLGGLCFLWHRRRLC